MTVALTSAPVAPHPDLPPPIPPKTTATVALGHRSKNRARRTRGAVSPTSGTAVVLVEIPSQRHFGRSCPYSYSIERGSGCAVEAASQAENSGVVHTAVQARHVCSLGILRQTRWMGPYEGRPDLEATLAFSQGLDIAALELRAPCASAVCSLMALEFASRRPKCSLLVRS